MSILNKFQVKPSDENRWIAGEIVKLLRPSDLRNDGVSLDANDLTAMFAREFEHRDTRLKETEHGVLKGQKVIPFEPLGGPTALSETYTMVTELGRAKWGSNQNRNLPRVDVVGKDYNRPVDTIQVEYGMTVRELMQVAKNPMINLEVRRKKAAVNAIGRFHDEKALSGDTDKAWYGLLNCNDFVPLISPITGNWSAATPEQIINDINKMSWAVVSNTLENHAPDSLLLPTSYGLVLDKPMVETGETIRSFIIRCSTYIRNIETTTKLELGNAAGNGKRAMVYKKDPDCVLYGANAMFIEEPPQRVGMEIVVPCWGASSGTQFILPKSAAYMDGI